MKVVIVGGIALVVLVLSAITWSLCIISSEQDDDREQPKCRKESGKGQ